MCWQNRRVTKCCFCIPLRLSSLLIGYLTLVFMILAMVGCSFYVYDTHKYINENKNQLNSELTPEQWANKALALYLSFAYFAVVFLYSLVIHILLLVGVHFNKHKLLRMYYIAAYVLFALTIPLIVITYLYMGFVITAGVLKWSVTVITCITTVRSYYLDITEEKKPPAYEMQPLSVPEQKPVIK